MYETINNHDQTPKTVDLKRRTLPNVKAVMRNVSVIA